MAWKLQIDSGPLAGQSFWLNQEVARVGSAPECDVKIDHPDVAPHLLTVQCMNGSVRLRNRSNRITILEGNAVQPGQWHPWRTGERLVVSHAISLRLLEEDKPHSLPFAPLDTEDDEDLYTPPEESYAADSAASGRPAAGTEAKKSSTATTFIQLGVIGMCFALVVVMLIAGKSKPKGGPAKAKQIEIEALMESLNKRIHEQANSPDAAEHFAQIRESLRNAKIHELRDDKTAARKEYQIVLERILGRISPENRQNAVDGESGEDASPKGLEAAIRDDTERDAFQYTLQALEALDRM